MSIYVKEKSISVMEQVMKGKKRPTENIWKKVPPVVRQVSQGGGRAGRRPGGLGGAGEACGLRLRSQGLLSRPDLAPASPPHGLFLSASCTHPSSGFGS